MKNLHVCREILHPPIRRAQDDNKNGGELSVLRNKIKLVQIIADSELGGGARHVLDLLAHIDKSRFQCYLLCPEGNLAREVRDLKGVEVIDVLMRSKFDLVAIRMIRGYLNQIRSSFDPFGPMIVHTHGPRAGLLGRWATPQGIYSVYTEHRWDADYHLESRINEWLQLALLKRLNFRTNLIIAVSSSVKEFLVQHNLAPESRMKVIPNGIDLESLKVKGKRLKGKVGNHFIIGNIGNLNLQKGQTYLIEAMIEVIKRYPHAMLEIVGEGEERSNLEFKIQNLKLEKHITLLGSKANPAEEMQKWDVFVSSSIAETFGIVVLEAFAAGLPVVATRVGGVPDIVRDKKNGLLIPPRSPKALADAITEILSRPALKESLIRAGKDRIRDFDWRKIINQLEREYSKVARQ